MFFGFLVGIFLCTSRPLSCCPDRVGWQARSWGEETKIARLCSPARPLASLSTPTSSKKISCMKEGIFSLHHEFCGCFFITFLQIANYEVVNRADFLISPSIVFFPVAFQNAYRAFLRECLHNNIPTVRRSFCKDEEDVSIDLDINLLVAAVFLWCSSVVTLSTYSER